MSPSGNVSLRVSFVSGNYYEAALACVPPNVTYYGSLNFAFSPVNTPFFVRPANHRISLLLSLIVPRPFRSFRFHGRDINNFHFTRVIPDIVDPPSSNAIHRIRPINRVSASFFPSSRNISPSATSIRSKFHGRNARIRIYPRKRPL